MQFHTLPATFAAATIEFSGDDEDASPKASVSPGTPKAVTGSPSKVVKIHSGSGGDEAVAIVAIVFLFGFLSIKAIANAITGKGGRRGGGLSAEEQAALERLSRGLTKMESRIDALETILVETKRASASRVGSSAASSSRTF